MREILENYYPERVYGKFAAIAKVKEFILEQFFPVTCPFCGKVISYKQFCCADCFSKLEFLTDHCPRCSKKDCICDRLEFTDRIIAPFSYDEFYAEAVRRFKFHGHVEYAKPLAFFIYHVFCNLNLPDYDMICYVPMYKKKQKQRGYNQAYRLALFLSRFLNIPVCSDLTCVKLVKTQHFLSSEERKKNLKGAFALRSSSVAGKRILLCDDVCTTAATIEECSAVLKAGGAQNVTGICVSSTQ